MNSSFHFSNVHHEVIRAQIALKLGEKKMGAGFH